MKDTFVLRIENRAGIDRMSDADAGALFKAILAYADGDCVAIDDLPPTAQVLLPMIIAQIDRANASYKATCERNAENGKKGGRPKKSERFEEEPKKTQKNRPLFSKTEKKHNDPDIDSDYESPNGDIKEKAPTGPKRKVEQFVPPTVDDVMAYCEEKGIDIDPEVFVTFYASKGWMVGKNKMKNWRQAVSGWAVRERKKRPPNRDSPKPGGYEEQLKGVDFTKLLYKAGG